MRLNVLLPITTVSEANRREHWAVKADRVKTQRLSARIICKSKYPMFKLLRGDKVIVKLTRMSARKLDDDNLCSALKAVRDGIADWLQINDGSDRIKFVYEQEKMHKSNFIKAEITIED